MVDLVNGVRYNLGIASIDEGITAARFAAGKEREQMNRVEEIQAGLGGGEVTDESSITDATVEAECRMMEVMVKSFMDELLSPSDICRFAQGLGSSSEARTHYMLNEINWAELTRDMVTHVSGTGKAILAMRDLGGSGGYDFEGGLRKFGASFWAEMKICGVLLEASVPTKGSGVSLADWIDDPYTMGDWIIKQLKDWEAATGGYFQEDEFGDIAADQGWEEDSLWNSTAERVLDIPSAYLPKVIRQAFALAAASLWGEG